ncbi:aspartyl-phosphate phosphatase Spo0E family protein [Thermaerobacter subterraneus]|nr:aspartyl-phosphate phosphatase Spo0E family protein [Thermaerobacter subterraneus]
MAAPRPAGSRPRHLQPALAHQAEIEAMRRELYRLARRRGYADPQVVELSRRLDDLIVGWHRRFGRGRPRPAAGPLP